MKRFWIGVLVLAALGGAAYVGFTYFAPKASTSVNDAAPSAATLRAGSFHDGSPGHHVSGSAKILRDANGSLTLRVENYEATAGPDVYFYLTPVANAQSEDAVERDGVRILVPGGAGAGQATLRGNFNVPLPAGLDPDAFAGLAVWCERFDEYFGGATLS